MSIKVRCRTNLDDYRMETWPTHFACPPRIREWVQAESGKALRIVGITHCHEAHEWTPWHRRDQEERGVLPQPYIEVELTR
jgi:hypothetical protein